MAKKRDRIEALEKKVKESDFWSNSERAVKINQELAGLKGEVEKIYGLKKELENLSSLVKEDKDLDFTKDLQGLEKKIKSEEIVSFLSGRYDKNSATLSVFAGAGGQDSQDWATILLRMYERYCQRKGFGVKILHQSFGEGGGPEGRIGTKSVTLEIKGSFAFGFLKKESGVHRLVRISPFSTKKLRHTSFALVEVLPEIGKEIEAEIEIRPEDLRTDFYRASGPGGQHVNKRETAVRITHLPTGSVVSCQSERSQGQNRERAMKQLYAKLYQLKGEEHRKELREIKKTLVSARPHTKRATTPKFGSEGREQVASGDKISKASPNSGVGASWGNQIRSYVLHPYKLVKDLRTNIETSNVDKVLDGDLDEFVEAEIKT